MAGQTKAASHTLEMSRSRKHKRSRPDDSGEAERDGPSKTMLKKQAHALQQLGLELAQLPAEHRRKAPLDDDLREAIAHYLKIRSHEARRRQMQLIGKLLRGVDAAPLQAAVDAFAAGRSLDAERLHVVERWRDELIADDEAVTRWMSEHPQTDVQALRNLIRNARREAGKAEPGQRHSRGYRELFKMIRQALDGTESA